MSVTQPLQLSQQRADNKALHEAVVAVTKNHSLCHDLLHVYLLTLIQVARIF